MVNMKEYVHSILEEYPDKIEDIDLIESISSGDLYSVLLGFDWCDIDDIIFYISNQIKKDLSICIGKRILFTDRKNKRVCMITNGQCFDTETFESNNIDIPFGLTCENEEIKILTMEV